MWARTAAWPQHAPHQRGLPAIAARLTSPVGIDAVIENDVTCGPRCYLRPGTHLLDRAHVGTHVEIKKSTIGEGSKVPHLSYIGDTTMGAA